MIREDLLFPLKRWKRGNSVGFCLGVDIGASGIRFQLSNPSDSNQIINHPHIGAHSANEIYKILNKLEKSINSISPQSKCFGSSFAIAGLRIGTTICPNNWPGPDSIRTIKTSLFSKKLYPPGRSILLNDLEAGAYGLYSASKNNKLNDYFELLWGKNGSLISSTKTAIMAMGCGLGAALLINQKFIKNPVVVSTEAGYLQTSTVLKKHEFFPIESKLVQYVSDYYHNGELVPVYEDFSSGRGLCISYQFFKGTKLNNLNNLEIPNAAEIADLAKKGDEIAQKAMKHHYLLFTRCAKSLALTFQCESIVMALSNQVRNHWFVNQIKEDMKKEFYDSTRPKWLENTRVFSQKKDLNFNLLGTTYMANIASK